MFLEFYGWVCGGGGGGVRNISSPLRGGIKYFPTLLGGGAKFYGRILEYPPVVIDPTLADFIMSFQNL
jgi:hypothetical protein